MDPFFHGIIAGVGFTTGAFSIGISSFYLLKKDVNAPIMYKTTVPSGGPAYAKKNSSKKTPKALTELMEWKAEQENEG